MTTRSWQDFLAEIEARPWYKKRYYEAYRTFHRVKNFPRRAKGTATHWYQRAKQGYSYQDVWDLDGHMNRVIVGGLRDLADQAHGWPGDKYMTFEEYLAMLREIADAFEMEYKATMVEYRELTAQETLRVDDAWNNFRHWFHSFWD